MLVAADGPRDQVDDRGVVDSHRTQRGDVVDGGALGIVERRVRSGFDECSASAPGLDDPGGLEFAIAFRDRVGGEVEVGG